MNARSAAGSTMRPGARVGSRLRCHCGEVALCREPKGHDARRVMFLARKARREDERARIGLLQLHAPRAAISTPSAHNACPRQRPPRFCHDCGTGLVPCSRRRATDLPFPLHDGQYPVSRPIGTGACHPRNAVKAGFRLGRHLQPPAGNAISARSVPAGPQHIEAEPCEEPGAQFGLPSSAASARTGPSRHATALPRVR